jgi:hypothetical protein
MRASINQLKLNFDLLIVQLKSLFIPKSWLDIVEISRIFLKISYLSIRISFVIYLVLMSVGLLSIIIDREYPAVCIGLTYGYFLLFFHLGIWVLLPSYGILLLEKLITWYKK